VPAHLRECADLAAAVVAHHEAGRDIGCAIQEELDRRSTAQLLERWQHVAVDGRAGERFEPLHALAAEVQRLSTCGQNAHLRAIRQKLRNRRCSAVEQMLAVIEHQQRRSRAQSFADRLEDRRLRRLLEPQDRRNASRYHIGVGERCEVDEPNALRKALDERPTATGWRYGERGRYRDRSGVR
jgi:hypothetical protein